MKKRVFAVAVTFIFMLCFVSQSVDSYAKSKSAVKQLGEIFTTEELQDATIDELQTAMKKGRLTSKELTQMYIDRINAYDEKLKLNSIIAVNPAALSEAAKYDKERKSGKVRGALHGIPIIIKDNIDVKGMPTTVGSLSLYDMIPNKDSFIVKKLREAGAVILGKANLSEFAYSAEYSESVLGGVVHNPYDVARTSGGSSGGTAVAVTCNFCAAGIGTDTGGSIRMPSIYNNLYGLRPSKGLTSVARVFPLMLEKDTTGPIARTPKDLDYVLKAMSGTDTEDDYTVEAGADALCKKGFAKTIKKNGLQGKKIGYFDGSFSYPIPEKDEEGKPTGRYTDEWGNPDPKMYAAANKTLANLRKAGAHLLDISGLINNDMVRTDAVGISKKVETDPFEYEVNSYFHRLGDLAPYKTLRDLAMSGAGINFSYLAELVDVSEASELADSFENTDNPYIETQDGYMRTGEWQSMLDYRAKLNKIMKDNDIDAIIYLPIMDIPCTIEDFSSSISDTGYLWVFGPQAGLPEIVLPMGFADKDEETKTEMPIGISLFGPFGSDRKLTEMAYAYQLQAGSFIRRQPSCVPALKDGRLNAFLKKLINKVGRWRDKKLEKKNPIRFKLLEKACIKASDVNWNNPKEVYARAHELAECFDDVR